MKKASVGERSDDRLSVLLLSDDSELSELYQLKLSLDGYDVETLGRDEDWLGPAAGCDLIFIDLADGSTGASEAWRQLRVTPALRHLPAILLTSERAKALHDRGFNFGPLDHVIPSVRLTSGR